MTIDEAVNLVNRTAETMAGGELVIPELPAFRLGDLVEAMGLQTDQKEQERLLPEIPGQGRGRQRREPDRLLSKN